MPFLVDDVFLRMLGISIPPFDMIWVVEQLKDRVLQEQYNSEKISDHIKENRLLYEFDEITKEEYEKINDELNQQLKIADRVNNMNLKQRIDILG